MYVINRLSILLQFTAISFLILMWSRALKVSSIEDKRSHKRPLSSTTVMPLPPTNVSPDALEGASLPNSAESITAGGSNEPNTSSSEYSDVDVGTNSSPNTITNDKVNSPVVSPLSMTTPINDMNPDSFETARAEEAKDAERKYIYYFRINFVINAIVYLFIFIVLVAYRSDTHLGSKKQVYEFDIECLGFLCLAEALVILASGIKTAYDLSYEMTPIFVTRSNRGQSTPPRSRRIYSSITGIPALLFRKSSSGLELQRQVLQNLIVVSLVISVFFLIRAVAFMYIPVIVDYDHQTAYYDSIYTYSYPLCFYQLPEFFPDLAIIIGIAQRGGIVNRLLRCTFCCSDGGREMNMSDLMRWQNNSRSPSQTSNNTSNLDTIFTISEHFHTDGFGNTNRQGDDMRHSHDSVYSDFHHQNERDDDSFASSGKISFQLSSFSSSNSANSAKSPKKRKPDRLDELTADDRPRV